MRFSKIVFNLFDSYSLLIFCLCQNQQKKPFNLLVEEPSRLLWWRIVDDFRNFCLSEDTEEVYKDLEEAILIY